MTRPAVNGVRAPAVLPLPSVPWIGGLLARLAARLGVI